MDESLDLRKQIDWHREMIKMEARRDYWRGVAAFYRDEGYKSWWPGHSPEWIDCGTFGKQRMMSRDAKTV